MGISTRRSARVAQRTAASSAPSAPGSSAAPAPAGPVGGVRKAVRKAVSKAKSTARAAAARVSPKRAARGRKAKVAAAAAAAAAADAPAVEPAAAEPAALAGIQMFPDVELRDDAGKSVRTSDVWAAGAFIVFLYPRANTPGCTTQACGFRDNFAEFEKNGYRAFGLSYDSPKSQTNWKNKHSLPFPLWCDTPDGGLIKALGAHKAPKSVKRSHFIVAKGGKILAAKVQISPRESIAHAKQFTAEHPADKDASAEKAAHNGASESAQDADAMDIEKPKEGAGGDVAMEEGDGKKDAEVKDVDMEGADAAKEDSEMKDEASVEPAKEESKADVGKEQESNAEASATVDLQAEAMKAEEPKDEAAPKNGAPNMEAPNGDVSSAVAPNSEAPKEEDSKKGLDGAEVLMETVKDSVKDSEPVVGNNAAAPSANEPAQAKDPVNSAPIIGNTEKIPESTTAAAPLAS